MVIYLRVSGCTRLCLTVVTFPSVGVLAGSVLPICQGWNGACALRSMHACNLLHFITCLMHLPQDCLRCSGVRSLLCVRASYLWCMVRLLACKCTTLMVLWY